MDEIAHAAGVTKPMLYRYFGSKENLYAAYLRVTGRELVDRVRAPDTRSQPPQERLRAGLRGFLTYVAGASRRLGGPARGEHRPDRRRVAREIVALRARVIAMLSVLFGDEAVAHAFAGAAESLATWWLNQPQVSIDDATDILMRIAQAASSRGSA